MGGYPGMPTRFVTVPNISQPQDLDPNQEYPVAQIGHALTYQQRIDDLKLEISILRREVSFWKGRATSIVSPTGRLRRGHRLSEFLQDINKRVNGESGR